MDQFFVIHGIFPFFANEGFLDVCMESLLEVCETDSKGMVYYLFSMYVFAHHDVFYPSSPFVLSKEYLNFARYNG